MNKFIMAICDKEEAYAYHFLEYINGKKLLPFQVQVFTKPEQLELFCKKNSVELLVVAESSYTEEMKKFSVKHTVVLADKGELQLENALIVHKYQSSEKIIKEIMFYYGNFEDSRNLLIKSSEEAKLIGVYTPIGRCLQTSFALLLGQLLSENKRILYLNFEAYSGFGKFMKREFTSDLTDLMYFLNNLEDNFIPKFKSMVESINGLDYIPPAFSFVDLSSIPIESWKKLLGQITGTCNYDYIILDLSDNVKGLFDLLKMCEKVYTITKDDGVAMAKIDQYEKLLTMMECEEIIEKTKKFRFPKFQNVPFEVEQLPFCELAKYVKAIIREDIND